jgi:hypothetical protein
MVIDAVHMRLHRPARKPRGELLATGFVREAAVAFHRGLPQHARHRY